MSSPKEKAVELYEKYFYIIPSTIDDYFSDSLAKKCALITVDEVLENSHTNVFTKYWEEVKQEIEWL